MAVGGRTLTCFSCLHAPKWRTVLIAQGRSWGIFQPSHEATVAGFQLKCQWCGSGHWNSSAGTNQGSRNVPPKTQVLQGSWSLSDFIHPLFPNRSKCYPSRRTTFEDLNSSQPLHWEQSHPLGYSTDQHLSFPVKKHSQQGALMEVSPPWFCSMCDPSPARSPFILQVSLGSSSSEQISTSEMWKQTERKHR